MSPASKHAMTINDESVNVTKVDGEDYICLTDMARSSGSDRALHSWLRARNTISFLGLWEQIHNKDFDGHGYASIKARVGENSFNPSVKEWVETTRAIGLISRTGRYGGTYAHKDIAFEFGTWLSPEFKLLVIVEFQRLKEREQKEIEWDSNRYLSRTNYRLHTDAIKKYILPTLSSGALQKFAYTNEADMLNRLAFGMTAAEWKVNFPALAKGQRNQRDYATSEQLIIMANLENLNSHYIAESRDQKERIVILGKEAKRQYQSLIDTQRIEQEAIKQRLSEKQTRLT